MNAYDLKRTTLSVLTLFVLLGALTFHAPAVQAKEFRWAATTDPQTLDPHAVNSTPVLGFLNNVYEGLVRRDRAMKIEGALAERWEALGDDGWRFHLRRGVTFHDGAAFTAEDVLFSYQRASAEEADVRSFFAPVRDVAVVDDFTVDFLTRSPNPIFPDSIANFMIMDKDWSEKNGTARTTTQSEGFATLNANGTGAFKVVERSPGVRTVLEPFEGWWGEAEHNVTRAIFTPVTQQATAVAALISGEVDFINPVPLQDVPRLEAAAGVKVMQGIEARVIMLGFAHEAAALKFSDETADANPFRDPRVRKAVYQAIDVDTLIKKVMRGNAEAASLLVSPAMHGYSPGLAARYPFDREASKALLTEAGYPDGFSFGLSCPNDRYINDASICTAVVGMLAKVGVKAKLNTMPVRQYWPELRADQFDMYLLGWSPGTFDAEHPVRFLLATPDAEKKLGSWNFGGFSDARIDELLPRIQREIDPAARQAMLDEVHGRLQQDVAYVPLYVQPLVWGMKQNVEMTQRADNFFILRWVQVN
ncbi:ABC transporter substrate-binding protein [Pelagibius litoralis]|uniref:ABC transporter substrate-binding protein n=1 Tax=Pelagibius litoralis TaxID=374515 RepID=A0A967KAF2_9PROT|nr:ABC transporter substrate-binding protein [Pelagibius litoralis]NIA69824.1 ABC transporter substrate-binding protein [Pelagibius litoralis]